MAKHRIRGDILEEWYREIQEPARNHDGTANYYKSTRKPTLEDYERGSDEDTWITAAALRKSYNYSIPCVKYTPLMIDITD